jgi:hypothetical protein
VPFSPESVPPIYNGLRCFYLLERGRAVGGAGLESSTRARKVLLTKGLADVAIGFLVYWDNSDGGNIKKGMPSDLRKIGWQALFSEMILMAMGGCVNHKIPQSERGKLNAKKYARRSGSNLRARKYIA